MLTFGQSLVEMARDISGVFRPEVVLEAPAAQIVDDPNVSAASE